MISVTWLLVSSSFMANKSFKMPIEVVGRAITPGHVSTPGSGLKGGVRVHTVNYTKITHPHKIPHPPQDTTPGDHIFKRSNVSPGVCYLV